MMKLKLQRILNNIEVNEPEFVKISKELKFDFHHSKNIDNERVVHILEEDINEIEVVDPVQIIPYTVVDEKNTKVVADDSMKDEKLNSNKEISPLNSPIVDGLAKRTEERKIKLKEFNYKFAKARRVLDMEKEPAYKRAGIELESDIISNDISATKIEEDNDGNLELKSNNSFLHDNVD